MKDYREYPQNPKLEPQDFTRIHDDDLREILTFLLEAYSEFSAPNFTDRHLFAERANKRAVPYARAYLMKGMFKNVRD